MENNIIDPKTLKVQSELPRIEFKNQNQLEKTVDAMVERFTGLVVTKDTYKPSKEVRAEINKVIKIIVVNVLIRLMKSKSLLMILMIVLKH